MRILYLRNFASKVNPDSYNLQEIGFGKALIRKGHDCDIVYYVPKEDESVQVVDQADGHTLRILWMKGLKVLSNSIYRRILRKPFLDQYDLIITTEYNQIMSYMLAKLCPEKLVLYHGPYSDNNNLLVRRAYDVVCLPKMKRNMKYNFVKSDLAKQFLADKGFANVHTLGVGLDRDNINMRREPNPVLEEKLECLKDKKVLLYIGVLEERRNILFLLQVFNALKSRLEEDIALLIVGDGKPEDTGRYFEFSRNHQLDGHILHLPKVAQQDLWQIYEASDVMVFPTNYDIFGMVLMESMYFRVPVISSVNGGASTLIKDNFNGIIIEQFDEELWAEASGRLLSDEILHKRLQTEAYNTISAVTWDQIADDMLQAIGFG